MQRSVVASEDDFEGCSAGRFMVARVVRMEHLVDMVIPVVVMLIGEAGEHLFERTVHALHFAVGHRMIRRGPRLVDAKQNAHVLHQVRVEVDALVADDSCRSAEFAADVVEDELCCRERSEVAGRFADAELAEVVNRDDDVLVATLRFGQRTGDVDADDLERR